MRIDEPRLVRKVGLSRDNDVGRASHSGLSAASDSHGAAQDPHHDHLVQRVRRQRYVGVACGVVEDNWADVDPGGVSLGVVDESRDELAKRSLAP